MLRDFLRNKLEQVTTGEGVRKDESAKRNSDSGNYVDPARSHLTIELTYCAGSGSWGKHSSTVGSPLPQPSPESQLASARLDFSAGVGIDLAA